MIEGKTVIVEHGSESLHHLLSIPSKDSSRYLNIIDILDCTYSVNSCVDMLVCVKRIGDIKVYQNKARNFEYEELVIWVRILLIILNFDIQWY